MNDKKYPSIALGTWSWGIGASGGDQVFGNHLEAEELKPVFEAAMDRGLRLWDTAAAYAMGASEEIVGYLAKAYPRDKLSLSTNLRPVLPKTRKTP